jgi:hypothetical protein
MLFFLASDPIEVSDKLSHFCTCSMQLSHNLLSGVCPIHREDHFSFKTFFLFVLNFYQPFLRFFKTSVQLFLLLSMPFHVTFLCTARETGNLYIHWTVGWNFVEFVPFELGVHLYIQWDDFQVQYLFWECQNSVK